ncbi:FkbM family methyltransferase [Mangrovivirga sp. M17]|uniref:FkbM family methyltransferase n=1 Tax=Mangrovivirga halotolerans TaxID=2993936 RepID=A0ABT3RQ93_9BACT|nr:FkbM family methyltransferase [Mangrovivirga halotolerans]MCX2743957.1 FkbM family methyltransferase [Mangrovivirga halotolerans]
MIRSLKEIIYRSINSKTGNMVSDFYDLSRLYYYSWKNRKTCRDLTLYYKNFNIQTPDVPLVINLINEIFLEKTYFFEFDTKDPFIIDCGANIGIATLYFKSIYPDSEILCFEANPDLFTFLNQNIIVNKLYNITPVNAALSFKSGDVTLYIPESNPFLNASLVRENTKNKQIIVNAVRLSDFIGEKAVDLLKIDIEGSENMVINELINSGKIDLINKIILEFHQNTGIGKDDLIKLLIKEGFHLVKTRLRPDIVTLSR